MPDPNSYLGGTPQHPDPPPEDIPPGATARIPLGRVFFVEVADQSIFTLEGAMADPQITEARLFPNHVVIPFAPGTPSARKEFQAVHLGNVTLKVYDAADPTSLRFSLPIQVTRPSKLGDTNNQVDGLPLDEILIDLGHRRGIPPHFIKGQIKREATDPQTGLFKTEAYRYEPLTVDLRYISTCLFPLTPRGPCNLREKQPFARYRLRTADGLTQDPVLGDEDISPREIYCVFRTDGTRRRMTEFDELISAGTIVDANDEVPSGDPSGCFSQNWREKLENDAIRDFLARDETALGFTAQTTIASSYGLLQVLYDSAIAPMGWKGVNGARNPRFLFDTPSNVDSGGGSLVLGSGYLRRIFPRVNPASLAIDPNFADPGALQGAFSKAFNVYNNKDPDTGDYGPAVLSFSNDFLPVPTGPIFASP